MTTLTFEFRPPGKDAPGFLRRQREALEFMAQMEKEPSPETVDKMVAFLAPYLFSLNGTGELSAAEASEYLLDASENQFFAMLQALTGGDADENPTGSAAENGDA